MHIGLFGGAFDPIHKGHLKVAKTAMQKITPLLDEIWFIPSYNNLKHKTIQTSYNDRVYMTQQAIQNEPAYKVSQVEADIAIQGLKDNIFTVDVIRYLRLAKNNDSFTLIMGADSYNNIEKWHDYKQLLKLVSIYVVDRNEMNISSTQIREIFKNIDKTTLEFIIQNDLYLQGATNANS